MSQPADIVILAAITLEYEAVLKVETGAAPDTQWEEVDSPTGLPASLRTFQGKKGRPLRVVVAQAAKLGPQPAANALGPLVDWFEPSCIAMCGVCAGRPGKTQLGDVIAAERLFFHDTSKQWPDRIQQDMETYNLRPNWKTRLEHSSFREGFLGQPWMQERPLPIEWQENWLLEQLYQGVAEPWSSPERATFCREWKQVTQALLDSGQISLQDGKPVLQKKGKVRIERVRFEHGGFPALSPAGEVLPFRVHVAPIGSGSKIIEDVTYWEVVTQHVRSTLGLEMEGAVSPQQAPARRAGDEGRDGLCQQGPGRPVQALRRPRLRRVPPGLPARAARARGGAWH